jgi:hypothetical protein
MGGIEKEENQIEELCDSGIEQRLKPKKSFFAGCSKMPRYEAPEILRSEAYWDVRRNDEG